MRLTGRLLGAVLTLSVCLLILSAVIYAAGTDQRLMLHLMRVDAPPESTGLPASQYAGMAEMITAYLTDRTDTFQYILDMDGQGTWILFHDYEQAHMQDCKALFQLDMRILITSAGVTAVLVTMLSLLHVWRAALSGARIGCLMIFGVLGCLVLWGCLDFSGLFITFHRLAFSNGLWILNPQTDLLIRLMPTAFFVHYILLIAGAFLLATGVYTFAVCRMERVIMRPQERRIYDKR